MQGPKLFLGLPHERLASSLCPARAFWRCSNPSALSTRSWRSPSTCACAANAGIQRGGGAAGEGATSPLAAPERALHTGQSTLTHGVMAGAGRTAPLSPPWGDGESSAELAWLWCTSPAGKPCPMVLGARCGLDVTYGAALRDRECHRASSPAHFLTLLFLPTNRALSLCPPPQLHAVPGVTVTAGPAAAARREQPPPSAPGASLQSD